MNILLFKFNNLGDSIVFLPAYQEIRRRFPKSRITLLTTPREAELYRGPLAPEEIVACEGRAFSTSYRRPWAFARWLWRVRNRRPGACLVPFDQGTAAHALAGLSGAGIRVGAKLEPARLAGSLTEEVPIPADGRPATWNWNSARALARAAGSGSGWTDEPPAPDLRHLLPGGPRPAGRRRRVVVHAGASSALNKWPTVRFASVATSLSRDFEVVWISHGAGGGPPPPGALDAPVSSISELAEWVAGADLFLGNNSGPMHLASALGCPGVAVTGPSARGWDPCWNRDRWSVLRHPNLSCCPCERIQERLAGCVNLARPMECLDFWTAQRVEQECRSRIEKGGGPFR